MMTIPELLAMHGIKIESTAPGRYYTVCPKCSLGRSSKAHQKSKVLGVTIEPNGSVHWGCSHCSVTGPGKGSNGNGSAGPAELITYNYRDAAGELVFQKVRNPPGSKSRFFCRRPDGKGNKWINDTKGIANKPLYRLPEIIEAIKAGQTIAIAEGEKDVNNLWAIGVAATCNFDGAADVVTRPKWKASYSEILRGADLVVFNDNDAAGLAHADVICGMSHGIAKRIRRLDLKNDWPEIPPKGDVSDWLAIGGEHTPEKLRALIERAPDYVPPEQQQQPAKAEPEPLQPAEVDAEITRLAKLSAVEYERQRKGSAAEKLNVRAAILDKLVQAERERINPDAGKQGQGRAIEFSQPEPWPEPVAGAELLDAIATAIRRHVVLPDHDRDLCALWVMHAYVPECFLVTPRLAICSPTKGCGKTTLLDVIEHLVPKPLRTSSITASVTFRVIEMHRPTLLIDEAKNIAEKIDLLEVLNDGHRRGGQTLRNAPVGDGGYEPRSFGTFAPAAIALIGSLPTELSDRAVAVNMKRRLPGERVEEIRVGCNEHLDALARKAMRWSADNAAGLADMDPVMPAGIYNRKADNMKPLLSIADTAGGEWPKRARAAAVGSHADGGSDEVSRIELLLADIRSVFAEAGGASVADLLAGKADVEISSADLVGALVALEGHPWAEMGKTSKPLTQNLLARMLKSLGIAPERRRYKLTPFEEAFARYLPPEGVYNRTSVHNAANTGTSDISQVYSPDNGCTVAKCEKPNNDGILYTCTVAIPPEGAESTSPSSNGAAKGLSIRTIQELADEYQDRAYAICQEFGSTDLDYRPINAWLRKRLSEMVFREHIDGEFARVMDAVFPT